MARRKKNISLEEELLELEQEATECEAEIKRLNDKKKELQQLIETKQIEALYQAVQQSDKTIQEVIAWINSDSQGEM